ncbi:MAG: D-alanyl-D-alanine carboxypeptidase family protein [Lachnospiraceae bacterium]|nr:D-alanyl-D-alanine carboxypeptidase family protein [Lachnospiraceae bacterium]
MKKSLRERVTGFFINMGRQNKWLRIPAIAGLAVSLWVFRLIEYFRRGTKRFACTIFILLCFMVGNSFAYPVFQEDNGFMAKADKAETVSVTEESDITLANEEKIEIDSLEILEDEDVLEGYDDAELHGMDEADKYSLSEILEENRNGEWKQEEPEEEPEKSEPEFSADDWRLVLINKQHPIPDDYSFTLGSIKTIKGTMKCDERIIDDLLSMMQKASDDGVALAICSPYRDLNYQAVLFNRKIEAYMKKGMSYMDAYTISSQAVTVPGASEHQIGLAIDIVSDDYVTLDEGFSDTDAGRWLAEHSCEYGFILRYPKGKEYITSIEFEPWHFRYVGRDAATIIMKEGITLEEFWDKYL